MGERIQKALDSARERKPYLQSLIMDLFSLDPGRLLTKSPDIYHAIRDGRLSAEDVDEVVKRYKPIWDRAKSIDMYDAAISAGQVVAEAGTGGVSYPIGKLAEIPELIPKIGYLYSYLRESGLLPTVVLGIYELLTTVDPTELMDIAPTYMISALYLMHREVKKRIKPKEVEETRESSTATAQA